MGTHSSGPPASPRRGAGLRAAEEACAALAGALVLDGVVDDAQVAALRRFLAACPEPVVAPQGLTASYWSPVEAVLREPRGPMEQLAGWLLRRGDVAAAVGDVTGVEWWWQDVDHCDRPKIYHTDHNVWLEDGATCRRYPAWASVLYLTDEGGPTAVFTKDGALAVMPRIGRYLLFPGELLHGVLHALEDWPFERVTLLLNWWRGPRPPGLCEPMLPLAAPRLVLPGFGAGSATGSDDTAALGNFSAEPVGVPAKGACCAPSLPQLEMPTVRRLGVDFALHAEEWSRQRLPRVLHADALSAPFYVTIHYDSPVTLLP